MNLGIDDLGPLALAIGVAIMIVSIVAMVLAGFIPSTYVERTITSETHNSSGTIPETVTLTTVEGGIITGSISISATDFVTGTVNNSIVYNVISLTAGTLNVTNAHWINHTADYYTVNYTYDGFGNSTAILQKGLVAMSNFGDWFGLIVIVAIAVIILGLVLLLRGRPGGEA